MTNDPLIKKKTRRTVQQFFQSLEKWKRKFPMIGKIGAQKFQRLEKRSAKVPTIGKNTPQISNDWKLFSTPFSAILVVVFMCFPLYARAWDSFPTNQIAEDGFDYTASQALDTQNGGTDWSDSWSSASFVVQSGSFDNWSGCPTNYGNKVRVTPANDATETAVRHFTAVTSGSVYVSFIVNFQYSGADQFVGVSLMSNTSVRAFFGEIAANDETLGLSDYDGASSSTASSYTLSAGSGNDYLLVAVYDFDTRVLKTKAFSTSDSIPGPEPSSWDAQVTLAEGRITRLDGVRLEAGEVGAGSATPGNCYFDEIRISTSWAAFVDRAETLRTRKMVPMFFLKGLE